MRQQTSVLSSMENIVKDVWLINQKEAFFFISHKAWEEHKKYVLSIFKEDNPETAEDDFEEYMSEFHISFVQKHELDMLLKRSNIEINQTYQISSFFGNLLRF